MQFPSGGLRVPVLVEGIGKRNGPRPQGPGNNAIKHGGGTKKPARDETHSSSGTLLLAACGKTVVGKRATLKPGGRSKLGSPDL